MTLYTETVSTAISWPVPIEPIYQSLPGGRRCSLTPKLPHLSRSDALFIEAVMSIPRGSRPWGIVTWLADVFGTSRVSIYGLHKRLQEGLMKASQPAAFPGVFGDGKREDAVLVTNNRLVRTVLTATFPGNVSIRPLQAIMSEAFDEQRSVGWISELRLSAGRLAGEKLAQIDTSALGSVVVLRDETFFQDHPILLVVDPISTTILFAQVCTDRQADTWGLALLMAQERGAVITGLVEDMARFYPKSQQLADMEQVEVQKDVWHLQREGGRIRVSLEKAAYRAMGQVAQFEKRLQKSWNDTLFEQHYLPAVEQEAQAIEQHDAFEVWLDHLTDAFELVDWRSGELRDPATATWLLQHILAALANIEHSKVQGFVRTLRHYQDQLLTALTWLDAAVADFRPALAEHLADPQQQIRFERTVARHWRLRQALINGHKALHFQAARAQADLNSLVADDPVRQRLAARLMQLLDSSTRTSSLIECINGLLKRFLNDRQSFRSPQTLQAYLNLFVLWHNMRPYQRGKRQGQSPYQIAGIYPGCNDWLELLGYPAN